MSESTVGRNLRRAAARLKSAPPQDPANILLVVPDDGVLPCGCSAKRSCAHYKRVTLKVRHSVSIHWSGLTDE
jgi:hypothetical protein